MSGFQSKLESDVFELLLKGITMSIDYNILAKDYDMKNAGRA
jgi:hypothetical protein